MTILSFPSDPLASIRALVESGALFALNDSGGKDSQAMKLRVMQLVPPDQLVIVHADLGDVEWKGALDHIRENSSDIPIIVAEPATSFFDMVERRQMFPSPKNRQCTSDLKRGPIERELRRYLKANPRFGGQLVNCMGMRAAESTGRAKLTPFKRNDGNSKAGREWFDWLPIHDWSTARVFEEIAAAGQKPHPVYGKGMSRFSCCFCIMASEADHKTAARLSVEEPELFNDPNLYSRLVATERRLDFTLSPSCRSLVEITGVAA